MPGGLGRLHQQEARRDKCAQPQRRRSREWPSLGRGGSQRFALFDHEGRNDLDGRAFLVDAFVHLAGLDVERVSGLVRRRRLAFVVKRQDPFLNVTDDRAGMRVAPSRPPAGISTAAITV
jgi:hypothetical protein